MALIDNPISSAIDAVAKIIDKVVPDKAAADSAKANLFALRETDDVKLAMAQIGVNQADAQSGSKFQAWWRPALAWVCLCDVFYEVLAYPILHKYYLTLDTANAVAITMPILLTLIGARSVDKYNGVDSK